MKKTQPATIHSSTLGDKIMQFFRLPGRLLVFSIHHMKDLATLLGEYFKNRNHPKRISRKNLMYLAWRNLWSHRSRAFLTIGGVTIGIASIIFLLSLGFGLERLVTTQVATFEAFTIIDVPSANLKTGKINQEAIDRIGQIGHIKSIDPVVDLAGRVRLEDKEATTETVVVSTTRNYFTLAEIPIDTGKFYESNATQEAVIDASLAKLIGFTDPGDSLGKVITLDLIVPKDLRAPDATDGPIVKESIKVTVVGITNSSQNPILYLPLPIAEKNGIINRTSLKVKIDDRAYVQDIRASIETLGFSTEYVGDTVAEISQVFSLFRIVLGGFGVIALVVATLGTFNTLTIALMERIREIGLLKTLGMQRADIFRLYIIESLAIGTVGGILGIVLGSIMGAGVNTTLAILAERAGSDPVSIYYSPPILILTTALLAGFLGFATGLYPAIRAIRVGPLDVLRYE